METVLTILARPEVAAVLLALVALLFGGLRRLRAVQAWRLRRALECLETGVRETYEEYVRAAKEASADGRLTDAERREAVTRAIEKARAYAAREGIDLLKTYAKEFLPVLVERIVGAQKARAPFAPLSAPEFASQ
jgi:hypothetical protein